MEDSRLHLMFVPLMAPGHLFPMVDMARLVARRNVKVTIVTTPLNSLLFKSSIERESQSGYPIQIQLVPFPHAETGIPEGCESADTVPSMDLIPKFYVAFRLLHRPIEHLFENLHPTPHCIIADKHITCLAPISRKFNVPRILFDGTNCLHLLSSHHLHASKPHHHSQPHHKFLLPGLPDKIELTRSQLPGIFNPGSNKELNLVREEVRASEANAYGVVVNTFEELEHKYVLEYQRVTGLKLWCVGPVSLSNKDHLDMATRGASADTNDLMTWLDTWPARSVIYVCLGSLNRVTPAQLIELGLGLEATKRPFVWVVRGAYKREEMDTWLEEEGFEERVKGRGVLIKGWAPQLLILSHKAIGAFFTHCGWNSTLEGISAGLPLVTFPLFGEQFFNEKLAVQLAGIGVSVGAQSVVHLGEEDEANVQVTREDVVEAVEKVMGEQGEEIRERATKRGEMARNAIEEGGSSYRNMSRFIQDIIANASSHSRVLIPDNNVSPETCPTSSM